jgi:hypothetical protein
VLSRLTSTLSTIASALATIAQPRRAKMTETIFGEMDPGNWTEIASLPLERGAWAVLARPNIRSRSGGGGAEFYLNVGQSWEYAIGGAEGETAVLSTVCLHGTGRVRTSSGLARLYMKSKGAWIGPTTLLAIPVDGVQDFRVWRDRTPDLRPPDVEPPESQIGTVTSR